MKFTVHIMLVALFISLPTIAEKKSSLSREDLKIQQSLIKVTSRIVAIRKELKLLERNRSGKAKKEREDRKLELQKELSDLVGNFESMASRVPEEELPQKENVELDWSQALLEITRPLLLAVHEISDKPRKIDLQKAKISTLENQLARFQIAEKHLNSLSASKELKKEDGKKVSREITKSYVESLSSLKKKYDPKLIQLKLDETRRSLEEIENSQGSIFEAFFKTTFNFFKVRGKNLAIALASFLFVWWGLARLYSYINNRTPLLKGIRSSQKKVISAFSNIVFVSCGLLTGLLSLYLQNDWLLLTLLLLLMFGIAWTSRQVIPKFISELRLIMNLGAIRENERVLWQGIPFFIKEIGFFVTLENPRLQGSYLTLPVGELLDSHSRPVSNKESWFPTKTGDWVLLEDGTFGQIKVQSMEQVIVDDYGALKNYRASEFLNMKPKNLSGGYSVLIKFGLDYGEQKRMPQEIPQIFQDELSQMPELTELKFEKIVVEFDQANTSSLDLFVRVFVNKDQGKSYYHFHRRVQAEMVAICNRHNLTIPFNQMTVHMQK